LTSGPGNPLELPRPRTARHSIDLPGRTALALGERTVVAGILNVTPDSFSDGGRFSTLDAALAAAEQMLEAGADFLDVGGESTRPGAPPVSVRDETARVIPVIEAVARRFDCILSVDTRRGQVARAALEVGAVIVNDISSLQDPEMAPAVATSGAALILMHMRGTPETMQNDTHYDDLLGEIRSDLETSAKIAEEQGIAGDKIIFDPGIGFGKSRTGNLEILKRLPELLVAEKPFMIGASRKSFIGATLDLPVDERLEGSLGVAAIAAWQGAHILRAHEVAATVRVVRMVDAIRGVN